MTAATQTRNHDVGPPSTATLARSRTHVLVATEDDAFQWSLFEGLEGCTDLRMTGCPSVRQTRQICSSDPPDVIIIDLDLLDDVPLALVSLATCALPTTRIVGLTERAVEDVGERSGDSRVSFLQKPIDVQDLVFLLTLDSFNTPPGGEA